MLNSTFWSGKKVLLTGHTGFVGSWISLLLLFLDAKIFGFSLKFATSSNLFSLLRLKDHLDGHMYGDIRNFEEIKQFCKQVNPDIMIHLAAQPLVGHAFDYPIETYQTNVMGTVHILECFKIESARVLLNVTTDKCYENQERECPYHENDALGGHEPYSSSKACSELITSAYRHSYFSSKNKGIATARAGNMIGGGDFAKNRLIPDFIRAYMTKKRLHIRYPHSIRPWQYILDPIFGYLRLVERLWQNGDHFSGAWNFGPKDADAKTVEYIIQRLCNRHPVEINWTAKKHCMESRVLKLDISKAKKYLDWEPLVILDDALERTMNWYGAFMHQENMFAYTEKEIAEYLKTYAIMTPTCISY